MRFRETSFLDELFHTFESLELFVGLVVCGGALGYLAYEALVASTTELVAVVGGIGVFAAAVLVFLG